MLAGEVGESDERLRPTHRLRGQDSGAGIGGATGVVAVDQRDVVSVARQLVRGGRADQATTDDHDIGRSAHAPSARLTKIRVHVHRAVGQAALYAVDVHDHGGAAAFGVDGLFGSGLLSKTTSRTCWSESTRPRPWIWRNVRVAGSR